MTKEQKLIDELQEYLDIEDTSGIDLYPEEVQMCIDALEKQTWVSVKDRLPEEPEIGADGYIVQEKNVCEPFSAYWDGERWTDSNYEPIDDVIAWMPLPESYKED